VWPSLAAGGSRWSHTLLTGLPRCWRCRGGMRTVPVGGEARLIAIPRGLLNYTRNFSRLHGLPAAGMLEEPIG